MFYWLRYTLYVSRIILMYFHNIWTKGEFSRCNSPSPNVCTSSHSKAVVLLLFILCVRLWLLGLLDAELLFLDLSCFFFVFFLLLLLYVVDTVLPLSPRLGTERFYFSYFGLWLCTVCHYLFTLHLGVNSTTYSLITTIPGHLLYYFCPKRIYGWTFQGGISVSSFSLSYILY